MIGAFSQAGACANRVTSERLAEGRVGCETHAIIAPPNLAVKRASLLGRMLSPKSPNSISWVEPRLCLPIILE